MNLAQALRRGFPWSKVPTYSAAQVLGAFAGAAIVYLNYHDAIASVDGANNVVRGTKDSVATFSIFATFPAPYFDSAVGPREFDKDGNIAHVDQREHEQINPKAGWVEHDANEIWQRTRQVINGAMAEADVEAGDIEAIGITNQREKGYARWKKAVERSLDWED